MDDIAVLADGNFVFIENNQPYKADFTKQIKSEIRRRPSKDEKGMEITKSKKIKENKILILPEDFSLRTLTMSDDGEVWRTLGYLCPYCLKCFHSYQGLHKEHMDLHYGPVKCSGCEVGAWLPNFQKLNIY